MSKETAVVAAILIACFLFFTTTALYALTY